jgi:hypothetical protein
MTSVSEAIENLRNAYSILEEHVNNPQNFNSDYANDFEIISWELYKHMNDIKYISNRYGVL